jgi:endogenous inhibitor of DNA gyrase (YacG/DUF329 family)
VSALAASDSQKPPERVTQGRRGYCPVCGAEVLWMPTAHLWPSRRSAQSVLPSQSGVCPQCQRVLMFTVVNDPAEDADSKTR